METWANRAHIRRLRYREHAKPGERKRPEGTMPSSRQPGRVSQFGHQQSFHHFLSLQFLPECLCAEKEEVTKWWDACSKMVRAVISLNAVSQAQLLTCSFRLLKEPLHLPAPQWPEIGCLWISPTRQWASEGTAPQRTDCQIHHSSLNAQSWT